ncbi:hypothetical protein IEQ34_026721 [Dendrobium chrysotoxum]|uniref:Uncharacterized protein n=1 Tax=Dendrobium chrysotoxum TaxID=161865 RepID=A0AAV7FLE4_DENCH|nr:hypothetical protein IEQ34_026721 [Dendrobium chrysotoxum]
MLKSGYDRWLEDIRPQSTNWWKSDDELIPVNDMMMLGDLGIIIFISSRRSFQNLNLKLYKFCNAWSLQTPGIARLCCPLATVQISLNFVEYFESYGRLNFVDSGSTRAVRSRLQVRSDGPELATPADLIARRPLGSNPRPSDDRAGDVA